MSAEEKIAAVRAVRASGPAHKPSRWPLAAVLALAGLLVWATVEWWHRDALLLVGAWAVMTLILIAAENRYDQAAGRWADAQRPE
jgi:hypothetical protein